MFMEWALLVMEEFFQTNPRLNMMVVIFDKMKDERKNSIIKKANQFIRDNTT